MIRATTCLLVLVAAVPAQADEVLAIQRGQDRRGRDALYTHLHAIRVDVNFSEAPAADLAKFLAAVSGNTTNFVVWGKDDIDPVTLRLKRTRVTTVMRIAQRFGKLRFVYRGGVVLMQPAAEVKELTMLRVYDVRAGTTPIPSYPGPRLGLRRSGEEQDFEEGEEESNVTASGFDIDKLSDLLRSNIDPESWDKDNVSLVALKGVLWVRQTERGHRKVLQLLRQLGVVSTPRRIAPPAGARRARAAGPRLDT